jgi:uncharacterized protein
MSHDFGSLVFTPAVKALQERYGSRRQYARSENSDSSSGRLGPDESQFIGERDTFYMATLGSTGWPYVQHRGGPRGFLKVIDESTLAFADFRGNKQYISTGNLATDNRVALIFVDYPRQLRLKILGRVDIFEGERAKDWITKVRDPEYKAVLERVYVIRVSSILFPGTVRRKFGKRWLPLRSGCRNWRKRTKNSVKNSPRQIRKITVFKFNYSKENSSCRKSP